MLPCIGGEEKIEKFCVGLKPQMRLKMMKENVQTIDDALRIAMSLESTCSARESSPGTMEKPQICMIVVMIRCISKIWKEIFTTIEKCKRVNVAKEGLICLSM